MLQISVPVEYVGKRILHYLKYSVDETQTPDQRHIWLDCLETLLRKKPSTRYWITSEMEQVITQSSIVLECLRQFRIQPWGTTMVAHLQGNGSRIMAQYGEYFIKAAPYEGTVSSHLGDPSDGKFYYPAHKTRNRQNVNAMRKAEANLDKFWKHIDRGYKNHDRIDYQVLERIFSGEGGLQRTKPWDDTATPRDLNNQAHEQDEFVYQSLSRIFHDKTTEITGNFNKLSIDSKPKAKTKGTPAAQPAPIENLVPIPPILNPVFHVSKDVYPIFRALFYSPSDGDLPSTIKWERFVNALVKLGFSAEKLHGSVWQFTPAEKMRLSRGISFHEPHPDGDVPFVMARRFGRRLARAYDWHG
ncbi:hypothetical protein BDV95DRAFT_6709 [Massariosphaeria phaeospora]|uniref:Uncharacterized protein n=1 Tax=Massariosphaeria phaeospora TaxID=100035 RepID=A0A7C8MIV0_9PLEO|nr:hypothetical protein BDV95DRAFT_6709 [Massariosphaeria phaeospora]